MIKSTLLVVALALAVLLIYAATRPGQFALQRSVTVAAPPDKLFALLNDLRQFNRWNPFAQQDPEHRVTYDAITAGHGARFSWVGGKSGAGSMTITESVPAQRVSARLDMVKPMQAHHLTDFTIEPQADGTSRVTWAMHGPMPYISKLMTVFVSMDRMIGGEFDKGLASLKLLAEAR